MNSSKIEKENEQSEFSNHEEEVSPHLVPRTPGDILTKLLMLKKKKKQQLSAELL